MLRPSGSLHEMRKSSADKRTIQTVKRNDYLEDQIASKEYSNHSTSHCALSSSFATRSPRILRQHTRLSRFPFSGLPCSRPCCTQNLRTQSSHPDRDPYPYPYSDLHHTTITTMSVTNRPQSSTSASTTVAAPPSEASAKLAEALDDFLLDVERKFKNISDEILSKCK